jgi:hypothetical protein
MCLDVQNVLNVGGAFTSTAGGTPGSHNRVAWWNGTSWQAHGTGANGTVWACAPSTAPSGYVYFGGDFSTFDGVAAQYVARAPDPGGSGVGSMIAPVRALSNLSFETGTIDVLVAGAMNNGSLLFKRDLHFAPPWEPMPAGGPANGTVHALDDKNLVGPSDYRFAGGAFQTIVNNNGPAINSPNLVQFEEHDDSQCSAMPAPNDTVYAVLFDWDEQGGERLYLGGRFTSVGGVAANRICKIEIELPGPTYTVVPLGGGFDADVFALAIYNGELYAGGMFGSAEGNFVHGIARWDGSQWRALGYGAYPVQSSPAITAIARSGNQIVVGGRFTTMGGQFLNRVARFTGSGWEQIGQGLPSYPRGIFELEGDLYALGMEDFSQPPAGYYRVHRFEQNGPLWTSLGGFDQPPTDAIIWNGQLVVGGDFTASGATPLNRIAFRDGNGVWQPMGAGFNAPVRALTIFNGELVAGGYFTMSGPNPVVRVARWDGMAWQPFGSGPPGNGQAAAALHVHDGELYAGGDFNGYLRRWTGSTWEQVGDPTAFGGCFGGVATLASYYGDLIVGGSFSCGSNGILRWDGTSYGPMAPGAGGVPNVGSLVVIGGDLWFNGVFTSAGSLPASGLTRWRDQATWVVIEPESVTANPGDDVVFTAFSSHAIGNYFWFHNGEAVSGGAVFDPTLGLPDVEAGDAGDYQCHFQTLCGQDSIFAYSNIATLTVNGTVLLGDMNCDGVVNVLDVDPFALALVDPAAYAAQYPACDPMRAEINGDGTVDGRDVGPMVELILP